MEPKNNKQDFNTHTDEWSVFQVFVEESLCEYVDNVVMVATYVILIDGQHQCIVMFLHLFPSLLQKQPKESNPPARPLKSQKISGRDHTSQVARLDDRDDWIECKQKVTNDLSNCYIPTIFLVPYR